MSIAHHRNVLDRITISDFGCIRDLGLALTPIHALIGPNDTGKSTVLRAAQRLLEIASVGTAVPELIRGGHGPNEWGNSRAGTSYQTRVSLGQPAIIRWQPNALKQSSKQLIDPRSFLIEGRGLPGMLARAFLADPSSLAETNARIGKVFPTIRSVRVEPRTSDELGILFVLHSGQKVHALEMSDGVLYWLAFDTLRYLEGDWVLLLEEPENGLHPSRIAEVMKSIRNVVETSAGKIQVIMATHSPIVVNELHPDEVTLITRDAERGSIATPITKTQNFEERSKVYALGELWLSYANGRDEVDLVPLSAE